MLAVGTHRFSSGASIDTAQSAIKKRVHPLLVSNGAGSGKLKGTAGGTLGVDVVGVEFFIPQHSALSSQKCLVDVFE